MQLLNITKLSINVFYSAIPQAYTNFACQAMCMMRLLFFYLLWADTDCHNTWCSIIETLFELISNTLTAREADRIIFPKMCVQQNPSYILNNRKTSICTFFYYRQLLFQMPSVFNKRQCKTNTCLTGRNKNQTSLSLFSVVSVFPSSTIQSIRLIRMVNMRRSFQTTVHFLSSFVIQFHTCRAKQSGKISSNI